MCFDRVQSRVKWNDAVEKIVTENQMRHNKIISWERLFEVVDKVETVSPWLSRQIHKRASEWPLWMSGAKLQELQDGKVWIHLPASARNRIEGEICLGHLLNVGEFTVRLALMHFRRELPFRYRILGAQVETHNVVDRPVDIRWEFKVVERERLRLELTRESRTVHEYSVPAYLEDGRLAATLTFRAAFELEKFLPA